MHEAPEAAHQQRDRQAAYFRQLAEFNMSAARLAHEALCDIAEIHDAEDEDDDQGDAPGTAAKPAPAPPSISKPVADLARATRAVIAAVQAENALFAPARTTGAAREPAPEPPRAPHDDPRRAPLREALHEAAADPDPARRRKTRAAADTAVESALLDDPDKQTPIYTHLKRIAAALNITLNPAKLSDAVLGMPPRVYTRDR